MSQALALAVLAGVVSVGLGLALPIFVQLPIMLAGLTMGTASAMIAAATAIVVISFFAGLLPALHYLVVLAFPAVWIVRQALLSRQDQSGLAWYPPGLILAQLSVMAVCGIALAFLVFMGQPNGLVGVVEAAIAEMIAQISAATDQPVPELEDLVRFTPQILASTGVFWLFMQLLNALIAQAVAVRAGWNRRPSPKLTDLMLPGWLWPLTGVAVIAAMIGPGDIGLFGSAVLMVLIVPYALLGLAVIHKYANRWPNRQLGLIAVYAGIFVGIIVFTLPVQLAVVALGMVEDWAHLRRHM